MVASKRKLRATTVNVGILIFKDIHTGLILSLIDYILYKKD